MKRAAWLIVFLFIFNPGFGKDKMPKVSIELLPGGTIALPTPLTLYQQGMPKIKFIARYQTEPFRLPLYYSVRMAYSPDRLQGVELEFNHLKIKLTNKPHEVEWFSVSHGYNQIWINYFRDLRYFCVRAGLGPVLAHPENKVREKELPGNLGLWEKGYYLSGISSQIALQKKLWLGSHFFLSAEAKLNLAYARVPIVDGYAKVPVCALHALTGIGFAF